jgi:glycerate 2-kinase
VDRLSRLDSDESFVNATLLEDARAISMRWSAEMTHVSLIEQALEDAFVDGGPVDVVAVGKASREMAAAARRVLGTRVHRQIVVSDVGEESFGLDDIVIVGEHPVPGAHSLRAGVALLTFLESTDHAESVVFLLSGGASSLCVAPAPPLTVEDLGEVWRCALRAGVDITSLNQIRATTSLIGGGALLRHVRAKRSTSLILVDNVVSGAQWVASAMTYDYEPAEREVDALWESVALNQELRSKMHVAFAQRRSLMEQEIVTEHDNVVVAEPAMMLTWALAEATRRGYQCLNRGARVAGDVAGVANEWGEALRTAGPRSAILGVGEVTVRVDGAGEGGRCQEFAWRMAREMTHGSRDAIFLARSSDGRDFIRGVAGAWVSNETWQRTGERGFNWDDVVRTHDTYPALAAVGQLIEGGHTGWNLCDIYVALID